jgi:FAD-linked sulfhydryl oxidase
MGYSPKLWGREGWHFIHYIALNYPPTPTEKEKNIYLQFFNSLETIIPCPFCGQHFAENMKNNPPRLENNKELFNWTVEMHNLVNKQNGKKELTPEQALKQLNKKRQIVVIKENSNEYLKIAIVSFMFISFSTWIGYKLATKQ